MKTIALKTCTLLSALLLFFTVVCTRPVYASAASDSGGGNAGIIIDAIVIDRVPFWRLFSVGTTNWDDYLNSVKFDTVPLTDSVATSTRSYYTDGGAGFSGGGNGGGSRGTESVYNSGSTVKTPIVSATSNNFTLNIPTTNYNNTTNNYYETYNINNISYNNEYNTYNYEITNNNYEINNYYVTYAPTFVNITYLSSGSSTPTSNFYFYELPDGRNSYDLKAEDVWGQYFVYDTVNYNSVAEDDGTAALYHFDGDFKDSSFAKGSAKYTSANASYNYVEHSGFGSALYWDNKSYQLDLGSLSGTGTFEFMLYLTESGTSPFEFTESTSMTTGTINALSLSVPNPSYYLPEGSSYQTVTAGTLISTSSPTLGNGYTNYDRTSGYSFVSPAGYLLNIGGTGYIPYRIVGTFNLLSRYSTKWTNNAIVSSYVYVTAAVTSAKVVLGDDKYTVGVGSWHNIAVSSGSLYIDGNNVDLPTGGASVSGNTIYKPAEWTNYWMIDEVRVSNQSLYSSNYVPSHMPFDTNKVLVLPDVGQEGQIAVKSNYPVADMRVGGVRATYPATGDVYVNLDKHIVKDVQQYQEGGWVSVGGSIYTGGEWKVLKDYDMKKYTIEEPIGGGGSSSSSSSDSSSSSGGGGGGGSDNPLDWLGDLWNLITGGLMGLITTVIGGIVSLITTLISGIISIVGGLFEALFSLVTFSTDFGGFMTDSMGFIPSEITSVLVVALSLSVVLMIINFFR